MTEYFNYYDWNRRIQKVSNPDKAIINTKKYLGNNTLIYPSDKPKYKYKIFDPNKNKWIYFGSMLYEDYLKHNDEKRKKIIFYGVQILKEIGKIIHIPLIT